MMTHSPPVGPRPKSALPSYLINGSSPLHAPAHNAEREKLYASLSASTNHRQSVDLNGSELIHNGNNISKRDSRAQVGDPPRDPRDDISPSTPPTTSRSASPYTLNPPIDFDGLSWPSQSTQYSDLMIADMVQALGRERGLRPQQKSKRYG